VANGPYTIRFTTVPMQCWHLGTQYSIGTMSMTSFSATQINYTVSGGDAAAGCGSKLARSGLLVVNCGASSVSFMVRENPTCYYLMVYSTTTACPTKSSFNSLTSLRNDCVRLATVPSNNMVTYTTGLGASIVVSNQNGAPKFQLFNSVGASVCQVTSSSVNSNYLAALCLGTDGNLVFRACADNSCAGTVLEIWAMKPWMTAYTSSANGCNSASCSSTCTASANPSTLIVPGRNAVVSQSINGVMSVSGATTTVQVVAVSPLGRQLLAAPPAPTVIDGPFFQLSLDTTTKGSFSLAFGGSIKILWTTVSIFLNVSSNGFYMAGMIQFGDTGKPPVGYFALAVNISVPFGQIAGSTDNKKDKIKQLISQSSFTFIIEAKFDLGGVFNGVFKDFMDKLTGKLGAAWDKVRGTS